MVPPRWGSCPARTAEWDESLDPVFFNGGAGESESDSLTEQESDRDADGSGDGDANAGERILDIDRAIQAGYAEYAASRAAAEAAECDDQQWAVSISDGDGGAGGSFVVTIALASAPGPSQRICWLCGQRSRFRCLLCFMEKVRSPARYCGEICQRLDWCRHKQVHKVTRGRAATCTRRKTRSLPSPAPSGCRLSCGRSSTLQPSSRARGCA